METSTMVYILTFLLIISIIFNCYQLMQMKNIKNNMENTRLDTQQHNKFDEDKIIENTLVKISESVNKVFYELDEDYRDELCYELKKDFNIKLEFLENVPYDDKLIKKFIPQEKLNNGDMVYSIDPVWIRNGKVIKRGKIEKR